MKKQTKKFVDDRSKTVVYRKKEIKMRNRSFITHTKFRKNRVRVSDGQTQTEERIPVVMLA